jgi:hypothetical protein
MAIDFFGVRLAGRIRQFVAGAGSGPGKVVELWVQDQSSALTEDLGALAFVSEINLQLKMGENASISLVLTPPFEDALTFMQSELIRFGNGRLEVEIGYSTGTDTGGGATAFTTLPFSGFLQKPDVSIGSDITITLHALGVGYQMNVVGGVKSEAFPANTTPADAVRQTLEAYVKNDGSSSGLRITDLYKFVSNEKQGKLDDVQAAFSGKAVGSTSPDNATDPFFKIPDPNTVTQGVNGKPDANIVNGLIHKGPRNDWWFVKETVQEYNYDLFIQGNDVYIVEKSFWIANGFGQKGDRKQFLLRGNVDPTQNMFPILSFQSPTDAVWLQPGIGKMIARDVDPNKQKTEGEVHTASAQDTPIARGKDSADPVDIVESSQKYDDEIAAIMHPGDPNDPKVQKQIDAHWTDKNMQSGIQGQFTTIGIPSLTPGETVQVGGFQIFGKSAGNPKKALFNGPYGVIEVNHKVGVGGWETTFLGIMNYFPKAFIDARKQAEAQASADQTKSQQATQVSQDNAAKTNAGAAKPTKATVAKDEPPNPDSPRPRGDVTTKQPKTPK